ncbi:MAG: hypothetical protein MJE77_07800 [Proteobacteria bacterium]|nr:hypothetical protein [Pseudomonadota bacterium]
MSALPRWWSTALAAILAAALVGCGTTTIMTNDKHARIYVNGQLIGKGKAEITQRGLPRSVEVLVKTRDGRRETVRMKRQFTGTTFLLGLVTLSIGFLTGWEYPYAVVVDLPDKKPPQKTGWDKPASSWSRPPDGWQPKTDAEKPVPAPAKAPASRPSGSDESAGADSPWDRPPPENTRRPADRRPQPTSTPGSSHSDSSGGADSAWDRPPKF